MDLFSVSILIGERIKNMDYFYYDEGSLEALKAKDETLKEIIDQLGPLYIPIQTDLFEAIVFHIVGQQVSKKVQETIWQRLQEEFGAITPEKVNQVDLIFFQKLGISRRKASCIQEIAHRIVSGQLDLESLRTLEDEEVIETLSAFKGIGPWTAEMVLLFSLQRLDVFSYSDYGVKRGLRMLYGHKEIDPSLFEEYRQRFSPYGSLASLYLWQISNGALEELKDPAFLQKEKKLKKEQD